MEFLRANKVKPQESAKYQRVPSPMSYIMNYNKQCNEENEQSKQIIPIDQKHKSLFLWNDGYVSLNQIKVPAVLEARKAKQKRFQLPQSTPSTGVNATATVTTSNLAQSSSSSNHQRATLSHNYLSQASMMTGSHAGITTAAPPHPMSFSYAGGIGNGGFTSATTLGHNGALVSNGSDTEDDNNVEAYRSSKQMRERQHEKELFSRTERLQKLIESNNKKQKSSRLSVAIVPHPSAHFGGASTTRPSSPNSQSFVGGSSVFSIAHSTATPGYQLPTAEQLDTNQQRKYFSHTKQQMLELQNHLLTSQKISKEIMDRKGLSLRKVLSSIPQEKLMQIIDNKQFHFKQIMNEKIFSKQNFRLKSKIAPRFTGENNYDFNRKKAISLATDSFQIPIQHNHHHARKKTMSSATSATTAAQHNNNIHLNHHHNNNNNNIPIRKSQSQQQMRISSKEHDLAAPATADQTLKRIQTGLPQSSSSNQQLGLVKESSQELHEQSVKSVKRANNYFLDEDGLFYEKNEGHNRIMKKSESAEQLDKLKVIAKPMSRELHLRVKSGIEVKQTIERFHEIQASYREQLQNPKQDANGTTSGIAALPPHQFDQNHLMSVSYEPKTSLGKMLQHEDQDQRGQFISTLEEKQKKNERKNFFNYSNYFYGKYSKQNNGTSTKLSSNAVEENLRFQVHLQAMIDEIDGQIVHL